MKKMAVPEKSCNALIGTHPALGRDSVAEGAERGRTQAATSYEQANEANFTFMYPLAKQRCGSQEMPGPEGHMCI